MGGACGSKNASAEAVEHDQQQPEKSSASSSPDHHHHPTASTNIHPAPSSIPNASAAVIEDAKQKAEQEQEEAKQRAEQVHRETEEKLEAEKKAQQEEEEERLVKEQKELEAEAANEAGRKRLEEEKKQLEEELIRAKREELENIERAKQEAAELIEEQKTEIHQHQQHHQEQIENEVQHGEEVANDLQQKIERPENLIATRLQFEDLPSTVTLGETYNVAVLLFDSNTDEPIDITGAKVKIRAEAPHSQYQALVDKFVQHKENVAGLQDPVELSCGEGIFELIFHKPSPCPSLVLHGEIVLDELTKIYDVQEAEGEVQGIPSEEDEDAGANGNADEDLSDLAVIISRFQSSMTQSTEQNVGPKVRHYLMLLKGRLWNAEGNSEKMKEGRLLESLLTLIETAPLTGGASVDAVLEALNAIEELLINKFARVMRSCSSCRALIRPDDKLGILSAGNMGTYHVPCLRCRTCNESVNTEPFLRSNDTKQPHHVACAEKSNIETDAQVIQCTVVDQSTENLCENDHVAAAEFWQEGGLDEKLIDILTQKTKWLEDNEYVRERAQRVALHVKKAEAGPAERREKFVNAMMMK